MRLVHEGTQTEVKVGDLVKNHRGESMFIASWEKPRNAASTGRVYVTSDPKGPKGLGYYPSVYGCEWIEREDRGWVPPPITAATGGQFIDFDRPKLEKLKAAHDAAILNNQEVFQFDGVPIRVDYAKYLIEYLEARLP